MTRRNRSGRGYAADLARLRRRLGPLAGADRLTARLLAIETRTQTQVLVEQLERLRGEVAAMRDAAAQASRLSGPAA